MGSGVGDWIRVAGADISHMTRLPVEPRYIHGSTKQVERCWGEGGAFATCAEPAAAPHHCPRSTQGTQRMGTAAQALPRTTNSPSTRSTGGGLHLPGSSGRSRLPSPSAGRKRTTLAHALAGRDPLGWVALDVGDAVAVSGGRDRPGRPGLRGRLRRGWLWEGGRQPPRMPPGVRLGTLQMAKLGGK